MNTMKQLLTLTLFSACLSFNLFAENISGNIQGKILDQETNEPLEYVSVAIFTKHDQELINGTITQLDGSFFYPGR